MKCDRGYRTRAKPKDKPRPKQQCQRIAHAKAEKVNVPRSNCGEHEPQKGGSGNRNKNQKKATGEHELHRRSVKPKAGNTSPEDVDGNNGKHESQNA